MSIPFGNETVTLVKRTEKTIAGKSMAVYSSATLKGCSWRRVARKTTRNVINHDGAFTPVEQLVCRVPAGQGKPEPGDLMILGDVAVTVTSGTDYQSLIEKYRDSDGAFVVTSVQDNARPEMPMPHYKAVSDHGNQYAHL